MQVRARLTLNTERIERTITSQPLDDGVAGPAEVRPLAEPGPRKEANGE
jgi:hypothetical protein